MTNDELPDDKEELRKLFKEETDPARKKEIAKKALDGYVCYYGDCCKKWMRDAFPYCSEEHHTMHAGSSPADFPRRNLSVKEMQEIVKSWGEGKLHVNVLDDTPRQDRLI